MLICIPPSLSILSISLFFLLLSSCHFGSVLALTSGEIVALKDMQAEWGTQLNWIGAPSCDWLGISCDDSGDVTQLKLVYLVYPGLFGTIPDSIGNLFALQELYVKLLREIWLSNWGLFTSFVI